MSIVSNQLWTKAGDEFVLIWHPVLLLLLLSYILNVPIKLVFVSHQIFSIFPNVIFIPIFSLVKLFAPMSLYTATTITSLVRVRDS